MEMVLGAGFIALCDWITIQLMNETQLIKQIRLIILALVTFLAFVIFNGLVHV